MKKQNNENYLIDVLIEKTNECYQLKKKLEGEKRESGIYRQALSDANQALNERTVEYNQVVSSKSWRITRGLRKLYTACLKLKFKNLHIKRKCQKVKLLKAVFEKQGNALKEYKATHGLFASIRYTNNILTSLVDQEMVMGDIKISIIMPVYNVNVKWLEKAIQSVIDQKYVNWELCIVDDASTYVETRNYLSTIHNEKIKISVLEENSGISKATNAATKNATGDYLLLMDNDDILSSDALLECYKTIQKGDYDIIYSDQDIISESEKHSNPLYKPSWSPDLLLCQMYLGHLVCFKRELFETVGGFRSEFNGSQDYDLLLRMTEKTSKIAHIDKILYSWRALESSTAMNPNAKPYAQTAGLKALQEHFDRIYGEGYATVKETKNLYVYDVRYNTLTDELISIIIPTKDHADDLKVTIESIYQNTTYSNFEIIILDNRSEEEETFAYFDRLTKKYQNIKIITADCEFNWSKINNIGIKAAGGGVLVFLNNDVKIITEDWLTRLAENALRDEIGIVGGLLLYQDGTIQHAGIVVGYGGYADHAFKGMLPEHIGTPYVSPCVNRNVLAVTGACMAVSRRKLDRLGFFDENFIICGSDVELCIRAYKNGYNNLYTPFVKLYHFESKSRGSYVPENDLYLSRHLYNEYLKGGDPFYNSNLSYERCIPTPLNGDGSMLEEKKIGLIEVNQPEIMPMHFRKIEYPNERINIVLPSINKKDVFGGIATAMSFFNALVEASQMDCRIIVSDAEPDTGALKMYALDYMFCASEEDALFSRQIVAFSDRYEQTIPVSNNDYFIFTGWWTAYCIQEEYMTNAERLGIKPNVFLYLIQDFEPGFYPWSSQYLFAELTYRTKFKQIAIFNSSELKAYFINQKYSFDAMFTFEPLLNSGLKIALPKKGEHIQKKKQILVYGRPSTARNAFAFLVTALKKWVEIQENVHEWRILSAGEQFENVNLGNGQQLQSVGKLSIDDYAKMLKETYAGVSIMVSPHPSYPPLEMSVFDVKVITNKFANKDLSYFNKNIYSVDNASPENIAVCLRDICDSYEKEVVYNIKNIEYCSGNEPFPFIPDVLKIMKSTFPEDIPK